MLANSETLLILAFVFLILLFTASVLRRTGELEENKKSRVRDLIAVGLILTFSPTMQTAGILIFWYGFAVLLYEYYRIGKREIRG